MEVMKFYIFFCFVARNRTLLSILCQRAIFLFFYFLSEKKSAGFVRNGTFSNVLLLNRIWPLNRTNPITCRFSISHSSWSCIYVCGLINILCFMLQLAKCVVSVYLEKRGFSFYFSRINGQGQNLMKLTRWNI